MLLRWRITPRIRPKTRIESIPYHEYCTWSAAKSSDVSAIPSFGCSAPRSVISSPMPALRPSSSIRPGPMTPASAVVKAWSPAQSAGNARCSSPSLPLLKSHNASTPATTISQSTGRSAVRPSRLSDPRQSRRTRKPTEANASTT